MKGISASCVGAVLRPRPRPTEIIAASPSKFFFLGHDGVHHGPAKFKSWQRVSVYSLRMFAFNALSESWREGDDAYRHQVEHLPCVLFIKTI